MKKPKKKIIVEAFDVLFILLLCFVTLFSTMIGRGKVLVGSGSSKGIDYSINWALLAATALILILYFIYVLTHSDKELRVMLSKLYELKQNGRSDQAKFGGDD